MIPSHSSQSFSASPRPSSLSVAAFNSLSYFRSGGSSLPCLSPIPLRPNSSLSPSPMDADRELSAVSRFTPSTYVDAASSISPLFATLTENTRGGVPVAQAILPVLFPLRYFVTSLTRSQSLHAFTLRFSGYPGVPPYPKRRLHAPLFSLTIPRKQCPSATVKQRSGQVCPGGA